ncbi:hypothetical protein H0H92_012399 [Tricholoma furcatifolium]|nr:hypothetical protein H0H92_012399 [Tricholoma furcatifolium]
MRGVLPNLSRSNYTQTHEVLTDLQSKWKQGEKFLGDKIETLPHYLAIPVVLFLIGLLDTLIGVGLPLSHWRIIIFSAGLFSSLCCLGVGIFIFYIIKRGSFDIKSSLPPFLRRSCIVPAIKAFRRFCFRGCGIWKAHDLESQFTTSHLAESVYHIVGVPQNTIAKPSLSLKHHNAFHDALATQEDEHMDHAIKMLPSFIWDRKQRALYEGSNTVTESEVQTYRRLLSMDTSTYNITAAEMIIMSVDYDSSTNNLALEFLPDSMITLIEALCATSRRIPHEKTRTTKMATAIVYLLVSAYRVPAAQIDRDTLKPICEASPFLALLFVSSNIVYLGSSVKVKRLREQVTKIAYDGLLLDLWTYRKGGPDEAIDENILLALLLKMLDEQHLTVKELLIFKAVFTGQKMPFILGLLPGQIGNVNGVYHSLGHRDLSISCFLALTQSIFTHSISNLSLSGMVTIIRDVIVYHKMHFDGPPSEHIEIFWVAATFFNFILHSVSEFGTSSGWDFLVEICVDFVQWAYSPKNLNFCWELSCFSPPRLVQETIIEILQYSHGLNDISITFSGDFHTFLWDIKTGTERTEYNATEKKRLLDAFRLLDPTVPAYEIDDSS